VRATGKLNELYLELQKENPEWATEARRHDMNHFMARLIFCFFGEDKVLSAVRRDQLTGTHPSKAVSSGSSMDTSAMIETFIRDSLEAKEVLKI
jgi:hypothetical protein